MKPTAAKLAIVIVALVTLGATAAMATHDFTDVDHGTFYEDATVWARDNGITLGCNADGTAFCPSRSVSRGENITFAYRYHVNVIEPALAALPTMLAVSVESDGTVAQTNAGVTVIHAATGDYDVEFGVDVTACYWSAVPRHDSWLWIGDDLTISLNSDYDGSIPGDIDVSEIDVNIHDADGNETDNGFDLIVHC